MGQSLFTAFIWYACFNRACFMSVWGFLIKGAGPVLPLDQTVPMGLALTPKFNDNWYKKCIAVSLKHLAQLIYTPQNAII